ncbi:hypothetical protein NECAME_11112 [Necator americanus]|uniref:RBR-type E3 ubiquitin transferase n=1 Tax=Necator americanus TaxID=51031 RepID=W2T658_NECAM|nr:hypothetical protein NECAME_11112 [Necator americanus]ETN77363.1 hypothetical protein NECAME_11112 [Necator americanus]
MRYRLQAEMEEAMKKKIDGCNKMICPACKTAFCWVCEVILNLRDPYKHYNSGECQEPLFEIPEDLV